MLCRVLGPHSRIENGVLKMYDIGETIDVNQNEINTFVNKFELLTTSIMDSKIPQKFQVAPEVTNPNGSIGNTPKNLDNQMPPANSEGNTTLLEKLGTLEAKALKKLATLMGIPTEELKDAKDAPALVTVITQYEDEAIEAGLKSL